MKKRKPPYVILAVLGCLIAGAGYYNLAQSGYFNQPPKAAAGADESAESGGEAGRQKMMQQLKSVKQGNTGRPTALRPEAPRAAKPEKPKEPGTNSQWW